VPRDVLPHPPDEEGYAAGAGARRGALSGLLYAVCLSVVLTIEDQVGASRGEVAPQSASDSAAGLAFWIPFFSLVAVPAGAVGGAVLGLICLPAARRLPPAAAAAACGLMVAVVATVAFPFVPLGHGPDDLDDFLSLSLLPGVLAGLAAGRHAWAMSRRTRS
jgi:hypothetical protein